MTADDVSSSVGERKLMKHFVVRLVLIWLRLGGAGRGQRKKGASILDREAWRTTRREACQRAAQAQIHAAGTA
jgi:hypothetical protein